ncbi:hypothetical protein, partial [Steroidobacter gossypii]|uniref:hypothetical protein n=1 Tax=Steroidobacter gossypii TaxID=2805490 RepID=UPI001C3F66C0
DREHFSTAPAKVFTVPWNRVHVAVDWVFTIPWKACSRSRGIRSQPAHKANKRCFDAAREGASFKRFTDGCAM